ncbi:MAG: DUF4179 domain-containing protein [Oscillospiraceae bacterium]
MKNNDFLNEINTIETDIVPLNDLEEARILNMAIANIEGASTAKPKRHRRITRVLLVAAALSCFMVITAAAAVAIMKMGANPIAFFDKQSSESGTGQFNGIRQNLETYNAPINQSVTDNGITATLDTVAVDDNFINVFMTFTSDDEIDLSRFRNSEDDIVNPFASFFGAPYYYFYIDEKQIESSVIDQSDVMDIAMPNAHTMKVMYHYAVGDDIPDAFTLTARSPFMGTPDGEKQGDILSKIGKWDFNVAIDKTETKAVTRKIAPQKLSFELEGGTYNTGIRKLVAAPSGALVVYDYDMKAFTQDGREGYKLDDDCLAFESLAIKDDLGNWIYQIPTGSGGGRGYNVRELTGVTQDSKALTFIPIKSSGSSQMQTVFIPMKAGEKIASSDAGGFEIISIEEQDYGYEVKVKPYGYNFTICEFELVQGENEIMMHGWQTHTVDRATSIITIKRGGYTAEDIAKIKTATQIKVWKESNITLDEEHAVTVPFE